MTSEHLSAAAGQLGAPEILVERSAQARAAATGSTVEEVLRAWAGSAAPRSPPSPAESTESSIEPGPTPVDVAAEHLEVVPQEEPAAASATTTPPASPVPALRAEPGSSPMLERRESPAGLIAMALALFLLSAVFAFALPALEASRSEPAPITLSASALRGRETYVAEGCWYCHTQQVRPIVTDAGLGPVTQPTDLPSIAGDTLGIQRIGPDLAHAGSREPTRRHGWLEDFLRDPQGTREGSLHTAYDYLSDEDLHDLAHFVWESR